MSYLPTVDFLKAAGILMWALTVAVALHHRLIGRYPWVFVYVFWLILGGAVTLGAGASLGNESPVYATIYFSEALVSTALALFVVLKIHLLLRPLRWRRDWHLAVVPAVFAALILSDPLPMPLAVRLVNVGHVTLMYFGCVTLFEMRLRRRSFDLGWNLKMVLLALTLPAGFFTFVFLGAGMGLAIPYDSLRLWTKLISLAFWIILAAGMTEYSPPRRLTADDQRGGKASDGADESSDPNLNLETMRP